MSDKEVSHFTYQVDLTGLRGYFDEVGQRTREGVESLKPHDLDDVPDPLYVRRVLIDEGILGPNAGWIVDTRIGKSKGWWLAHRISHQYQHLGEALTVGSLMGIRAS